MEGGHVYLELVEHNENGSRVASCRAVIWKSVSGKLLGKFRQATGSDLSTETRVLIHVKPKFHPDFGLSLQISDIDPLYTIGDMAKKLADIRQRLVDQGDFDRQKRLSAPYDFSRVAVLSPESAAGLGDFRSDADRLADAGICRFDFYSASFQGQNTKASMLDAMREVYKANREYQYDCFVIIRGGGATSDLNYLNEYELAHAITRFSIPVLTGIGHERDRTILDEVSFRAFDTPSKVIHHIIHTIKSNAISAEKSLDQVATLASTSLANNEYEIYRLHDANSQNSERVIERLYSDAEKQFQVVSHRADRVLFDYEGNSDRSYGDAVQGAQSLIHHIQSACSGQYQVLGRGVTDYLSQTSSALSNDFTLMFRNSDAVINGSAKALYDVAMPMEFAVSRQFEELKHACKSVAQDLRQLALNSLNCVESNIQVNHAKVDAASPAKTLARGFCIARDNNGRALTDRAKVSTNQSISIEFRDGIVPVISQEKVNESANS